MNRRSNRLILKIFLGAFLAYVFSMSAFTYIWHNGAGSGYTTPGAGSGLKGVSNYAVETYVIEGATHYLNGNSYIMQLLSQVEIGALKGVDYDELKTIADNAAYNMNVAKANYDNLIKVAEATPYNQDVIKELETFDFDAFADKNGLNPAIFEEVKIFLGAGDITASLKKSQADLVEIIDMLNAISETISSNKTPGISDLLKLNQECSQTLLFGQYTAQVFDELRKK